MLASGAVEVVVGASYSQPLLLPHEYWSGEEVLGALQLRHLGLLAAGLVGLGVGLEERPVAEERGAVLERAAVKKDVVVGGEDVVL